MVRSSDQSQLDIYGGKAGIWWQHVVPDEFDWNHYDVSINRLMLKTKQANTIVKIVVTKRTRQ